MSAKFCAAVWKGQGIAREFYFIRPVTTMIVKLEAERDRPRGCVGWIA